MPRKQTDVEGKFTGTDRKDVVRRENVKFKKDQTGTLFPTFRRSASFFNNLEDEDTKEYLTIYYRYSGGDAQYFSDCAIKAIKRYHKIGHYDEVVTAQETAFDTYLDAWVQVMLNFIPMEIMHDYLTNPPINETDDCTFGSGSQADCKIPLYERDTIITEYQNMERSGILMFPGIFELLKKAFFVVEVYEQEKVGSTFSPGAHFMTGTAREKLSDLQTLLATLRTNIGKTIKYCNMFGVPVTQFKVSDMEKPYTVYKGLDHPALDVFFAQNRIMIRDGTANNRQLYPTYNETTENMRFIFKEKPDEVQDMYIIMKLLYWAYNATYNKYGGALTMSVGTTQDCLNFMNIYQDDTTQGAANGFNPLGAGDDGVLYYLFRFAAMYEQTNVLNLSITGTYLSGDNDVSIPMYHYMKGYKKYGLFKNVNMDDVVVEQMAKYLNLQTVKKNNFASLT